MAPQKDHGHTCYGYKKLQIGANTTPQKSTQATNNISMLQQVVPM